MINFAQLTAVIGIIMLAIKTYFDAHPGSTDADTRSLLYTIGAAVLGVLLTILAFYSDPASVMPAPWLSLVFTGISASLPPGLGVSLLTLLNIKVLGLPNSAGSAQSVMKPTRGVPVLWR